MKFGNATLLLAFWKSRPARGAWIEIVPAEPKPERKSSRPARGAWIEMLASALA